jgi:hypothetical protein
MKGSDLPYLDDLVEQIEQRVKTDLAKIYRPSSDDETRAWKAAIIDIVGASISKEREGA